MNEILIDKIFKAKDVWEYSDYLPADNIIFRIVRFFKFLRSIFPDILSNWFIAEANLRFYNLKKEYLELNSVKLDPSNLNGDNFEHVKDIIRKIKLRKEGIDRSENPEKLARIIKYGNGNFDSSSKKVEKKEKIRNLLYGEYPYLKDHSLFHHFPVEELSERLNFIDKFQALIEKNPSKKSAITKLMTQHPGNIQRVYKIAQNMVESRKLEQIKDDANKTEFYKLLDSIKSRLVLNVANLKLIEQLKLQVFYSPPEELLEIFQLLKKVEAYVKEDEADEIFLILFRLLIKRPKNDEIRTAFKMRKWYKNHYFSYLRLQDTHNKIQVYTRKNSIVLKRKSEDSANGNVAYEKWASDLDHLLGSSFVPLSLLSSSAQVDNKIKIKSVVQPFYNDALTLEKFLMQPGGEEAINELPKWHVHAYLIFNLLRGRNDGHLGNTIIWRGRLLDIDEESDFPEYNHYLDPSSRYEFSHKSRMPLMGLHQAAKPFSKAFLALFSSNVFLKRVKLFLKSRILNEESKAALIERIEKLQMIMEFEFEKEVSYFSPRDLYFFIHGKEELYFYSKLNGIKDIYIFRQIYSWEDRQHRSFLTYIKGFSEYPNLKDVPYQGSDFDEDSENWRLNKGYDPIADVYRQFMQSNEAVLSLKRFDLNAWRNYPKKNIQLLSQFSSGLERIHLRKLVALYGKYSFEVDDQSRLRIRPAGL